MTLTQRHKLHTAAAAAFCVTDRASVHPIGHRLRLRPQTLTYDQIELPYLALVCRLIVSTPVIHVITWITCTVLTYQPWRNGRLS